MIVLRPIFFLLLPFTFLMSACSTLELTNLEQEFLNVSRETSNSTLPWESEYIGIKSVECNDNLILDYNIRYSDQLSGFKNRRSIFRIATNDVQNSPRSQTGSEQKKRYESPLIFSHYKDISKRFYLSDQTNSETFVISEAKKVSKISRW